LPLPCLGSGFDHGSFYAKRVLAFSWPRSFAAARGFVGKLSCSQSLGASEKSYQKFMKKFIKNMSG
jgi:hypothetical protein